MMIFAGRELGNCSTYLPPPYVFGQMSIILNKEFIILKLIKRFWPKLILVNV